jgi:hypothetical protein
MLPLVSVPAAIISLAQSGAAPASATWSGVVWAGIMLGLVVVGASAILILRKRLFDPHSGGGEGLTLAELREMRERGDLSPEEYERAKALVIGRAGRSEPERKGRV